MRLLHRRLQQNQALLRMVAIDARANRLEIEIGLIAEQRKLEPVLSANRPMTVRARTAGHREDRHHVFHKAQLGFFARRGDFHRRGSLQSPAIYFEDSLAIGPGSDYRFFGNSQQRPIGRCKRALRGYIAPVQTNRQCLCRIAAGKFDRGRINRQLRAPRSNRKYKQSQGANSHQWQPQFCRLLPPDRLRWDGTDQSPSLR